MTRGNVFRALSAIFMLSLAGCRGSPEDRINAAMPISPRVQSAKVALESLARKQGADLHSIEDEYQQRLKNRARRCGHGYQPGPFAGADAIYKAVGNVDCFRSADEALQQWLGMRRIGLLLAMPAFRQVPELPPTELLAEDDIRSAAFAEKAGIAIVQTVRHYQVFDLNTGDAIRAGLLDSVRPVVLSPNGRVFVSSDDMETLLRDVATGDVLATLPDVHNGKVFWIGNYGLIYMPADSATPVFLDAISGHRSEIPWAGYGIDAVLAIPGAKTAYLLLSSDHIGLIEIDKATQGSQPRLISEISTRGEGWSPADVAARADGRLYFSTGDSVEQLQLATLQNQSIPFQPMRITRVLPMRDPDNLLIAGYVPGTASAGDLYVYSIGQRTLAKVDRRELTSDRLIYIPALRRNALVDGDKIVVLDAIATAEPVAINVALDRMTDFAQALERAAAQRDRERLRRLASLAESERDSSRRRVSDSPPAAAPRPATAYGHEGLVEAMRGGVLRLGNSRDIMQWEDRYQASTGRRASNRFDEYMQYQPIYVITGDFTIPDGLSGANAVVFVLSYGVPFPHGDLGHSMILDTNSGGCMGLGCGSVISH